MKTELDKTYESFRAATTSSQLNRNFKHKTQIAILDGGAEIIECIVRRAALDCKLEMDWGYIDGRALIYVNSLDRERIEDARASLEFAMPSLLSAYEYR